MTNKYLWWAEVYTNVFIVTTAVTFHIGLHSTALLAALFAVHWSGKANESVTRGKKNNMENEGWIDVCCPKCGTEMKIPPGWTFNPGVNYLDLVVHDRACPQRRERTDGMFDRYKKQHEQEQL